MTARTGNDMLVRRGVFRDHLFFISGLVSVNTRVVLYSPRHTMIVKRGRNFGLHNTHLASPSVHTNVTLLVTTVDTRKADAVDGVRRVSHNCRGVRKHLGTVKTEVAQV